MLKYSRAAQRGPGCPTPFQNAQKTLKFIKHSAAITLPATAETIEVTVPYQTVAQSEDPQILNTSGEVKVLKEYIVMAADDKGTRFNDLKAQEKGLKSQVTELWAEVRRIRDELNVVEDQLYFVEEYQIAGNAIEGLCIRIWENFSDPIIAAMGRIGIYSTQQLRLERCGKTRGAALTARNLSAQKIYYSTVDLEYQTLLEKLYRIKVHYSERRTRTAHPTISVEVWRQFVRREFGNKMTRSEKIALKELETLEVWQDEVDDYRRVFCD